MRVWTRQVSQVWDEIQETGRYLVLEEYVRAKNAEISDYYIELYRWFTEEARRYAKVPADAKFPIWLTVDESQKLPPAPYTVSFTLEIPEDEMVVVDYDKWGYRVNHWYVPLDAEDERRWNEELAQYGIGNEASLITGQQGNFYPMLKRKMQASWARVFEAPNERMDLNVGAAWEIRPEWVVEVEEYDKIYGDQWAQDFDEYVKPE